jgi:hypothetical protein
LWADHLSDGYPTAVGQLVDRLPDAPRMLKAADDEFLALCEHLWMLATEGEALQTQAAEARGLTKSPARRSMARDLGISRGPTVCDEIADRIEFNLIKRRLLLSRVQDMAIGLR